MKKIFVILVAVFTLSGVFAQHFVFDGCYYSVTSADKVRLDGQASNSAGNLIIPGKVTYNSHEYIVSEVRDSAFMGYDWLLSIVLPPEVAKIGKFSFSGCSKLSSFKFPAALTSIGVSAFSDTNLTELVIPEHVAEIHIGAFSNCKNLASVSFQSSFTVIEGSLFAGCTNLETVSLPAELTVLNSNLFYGCSKLKSIEIPKKLRKLVTVLLWTTALKSATLPIGLNTIHYEAFKNCVSLEDVVIPENVTFIGNEAFFGCTSLKSVSISAKVETIGSGAFSGCSGLTEINVDPLNSKFSSSDGVLFENNALSGNKLLIYPAAKQGALYTVPAAVSSVSDFAFTAASELEEVKFAAPTTSIGKSAFFNCNKLKTITLTSGITEIPESTFEECIALDTLDIPVGVEQIGAKAFKNTALKSLLIPAGVKRIGIEAFSGCSNLKTVRLPVTLDSIGNLAFYKNIGLSTIQVTNETPPAAMTETFSMVNTETVVLEVPVGSKNKYAAASGWRYFKVIKEVDFGALVPSLKIEKFRLLGGKNKLTVEIELPDMLRSSYRRWEKSIFFKIERFVCYPAATGNLHR